MINQNQVSISNKNVKMGEIPSVSLPPIICCPNWQSCGSHGCYAVRMENFRKTTAEAWMRNYNILMNDRKSYFAQIKAAAMISRFFRWHVGGDIIDIDYLDNMVKIARECKGTTFLAFTKSWQIVNEYFNSHRKPANLKIIMSLPFDNSPIENPHNLPTAAVIFKGQEPDASYKICGGNCTECACRGIGCWELKNGETIAFKKH